MKSQKRYVLLFLDNVPSHPHSLTSPSNVKLFFLPANTTALLQPLDQGIIKNMKVHYCRRLFMHVLAKMDADLTALNISKSITVLNACEWIAAAVANIAA